jgi:hypothetical protein
MLKKILNSLTFKPTSMFLAAIFLFISVTIPVNAETIVVKAGTPVYLELINSIDGNNVRQGQMVDFRVTSDVIVNGEKIIAAGSFAKGQIVSQKDNNFCGMPGEVEVAIQHVIAADGTMIPLSGNSLADEGADKIVLSITLTILCLFGIAIKGGKAKIAAGSGLQAYVASNTEVSI